MKKTALIFPGQGAQKIGMGREFYEQSPEAKDIFDRANAVLGEDISAVIFNGPEDKLTSTRYCQPAIFTMSMAALAAFRVSAKYDEVAVAFTAGLSLGEYGALCAAGALPFECCLKLIQIRADLMETAACENPGKMAAVIGFDQARLVEICSLAGCEVANFNAPDQIVITGKVPAVDQSCAMISAEGCRKVVALEVSGAFHSSLMKGAAEKFAAALTTMQFTVTGVKVITNVNARPQVTGEEIRANLEKQIFSSVQWTDTVRYMAAEGVTDMVEIGPGRVLKALVRKIDPAVQVHNIQVPEDISALAFS